MVCQCDHPRGWVSFMPMHSKYWTWSLLGFHINSNVWTSILTDPGLLVKVKQEDDSPQKCSQLTIFTVSEGTKSTK